MVMISFVVVSLHGDVQFFNCRFFLDMTSYDVHLRENHEERNQIFRASTPSGPPGALCRNSLAGNIMWEPD